METYEVIVKFNDGSSFETSVPECPSPIHAIEAALRNPEVWKLAFAVVEVEVG